MPIFGKIVAEWQRKGIDQIIWRAPNSVYPKIGKIKAALVKEFERVAFVSKGRIISVGRSGGNPLPKGTDEIIWVDIAPKMLPFGIAKDRHLLTKDQHKIGFSGKITLRVGNTEGDIRKLLTRIVGSTFSLGYDELTKWLRGGPLISAFRGFLGKVTREDFTKIGPDKIALSVVPELTEELSKYGLELESIDITGVAY